MFRRILIANRGEVAARVLRTCRRLGIQAVAAVAEPDAELAWLADADAIAPVGGRGGYLDPDALLAAAREHGCSALHPGWGFLSENALFATRCEAERITFIGPSPASMRAMGDKQVARETMGRLGMPLIPGSPGNVTTVDEALRIAEGLGYPVLLKARSGGGGRGMRRVNVPAEMAEAFGQASAEGQSAFGDGTLYLEKLVVRGRHIEFQVLGDRHGNLVTLGERECSVQRRHQKLLEESPSPALSPAECARIGTIVADACRAAGYYGAGTVEMLRDPSGALYFMEMNTRLQVEHPVTEAVTGLDLVELQLRVAANEVVKPTFSVSGHAIECRVNAEDPDAGFRPAPGRVTRLVLPQGEGIRVDTHLRAGDAISPFYDSMVAKVIVHAPDRAAAIARMDAALAAMVVEGVPTTIPLQRRILADPRFVAGDYDTTFLDGLI
ncbi:MAG: biotin carboxylase N-terminal domain-containing protein [Pseudomonadota bacterium]|nr:biotin carboxylase N-terminal domain-containing protein [Pseudomonadota bacterium]